MRNRYAALPGRPGHPRVRGPGRFHSRELHHARVRRPGPAPHRGTRETPRTGHERVRGELPGPAAEAESPESDPEDTPEAPDADEAEDTPSGPEEEDTDTDEDEAGDEEPDEGEEEAEDEVEETSEEREDDDFLPPFDRKEIEKHPEL